MLRTGRRLRRLTRNLAACLAQPAGDGPLRRWLGVQDVVFMFHRVLPAAEYGAYYDPERAVTAECFAQLVPFLRRFFEIVAVEDLLHVSVSERPRCALTFDDGWEDNARCAWPLLLEAGAPATIFLVTDRLGRDRLLWPDRFHRLTSGLSAAEHACLARALRERHPWLRELADPTRLAPVRRALGRLPWDERGPRGEALAADLAELRPQAAALLPRHAFLHEDQIHKLQRAGCRFGAHTLTHPPLRGLDAERLHTELAEGRRSLRARFGGDMAALAYPFGSYDAAVVRAAAAAGYQIGLTSESRPLHPAGDPLQLPRVGLCEAMMAHRPGRFRPYLLRAHLMALLARTRRQPQPPTAASTGATV